ncbi:MAG TPA: hypothetical protein VHU19_15735 [Pyrinomonadaceae bacterium]|nr:hypothetical protein [Pyrinomonadaceae bacterium]
MTVAVIALFLQDKRAAETIPTGSVGASAMINAARKTSQQRSGRSAV